MIATGAALIAGGRDAGCDHAFDFEILRDRDPCAERRVTSWVSTSNGSDADTSNLRCREAGITSITDRRVMHITRATLSVSLVLFVLTPSSSLHAEVRLARLRPLDAVARSVLEVGRERSDLFHALAGRVDRSDVIVYISTSNSLPNGTDGRLQLVTVVSKVRYLLIAIRRDLTADRLVAMLGHELMHAVEVAEDRAVVDNDSLRRLYARIGHSHDSRTFDTQAAVDAGHRVLAEIRTHAPRRPSADLKH